METSYCLFEINDHFAAINTDYLEEVLALPELILVPNAPSGIVGVIDFHGEVLPVIDLRLNQEGKSQPYRLSDSLIIIKQADLRIGLFANTIQTIKDLSTQALITNFSEYQEWMNPDVTNFFDGMILNEAAIFILSEPQSWFNPGELKQVISIIRFLVDNYYETRLEQSETEAADLNVTTSFSPNATSQEHIIFRQRADNLRRQLNDSVSALDLKTLIVLSFNDQLIGIEATCVREFITVRQATPVPCCPRHIIGSTSLRGEILTVIDISEPLGLPLKAVPRNPKAVVIELNNTIAALVIEDVRDALFEINSNNIQIDSTFPMRHNYIQGTVPYGDQMMRILDLPKLLQSDELVVNEVL
ncbi:chemotaxis protein CheW [Leptothoe sp. PORK10 BA2]|uniref:chemotaxis protein CheW n=1 Tax=Leptothoe sp. PORK10 BA2 TaxID=3110254 RepID=UPI002B20E562|nr:chemotaxis protein CheW [Leptothoe sp. PORK10 BA2]MEA5467070.1 chemotaxis protein CheW [Leptothoe sp. PORK10 BA2]